MKVLLLTDSDAFAGTERHVLDLAAGLDRQGVEAVIGCPAQTPLAVQAEETGFSHTEVPRGFAGAVRALQKLRRGGAFDVIHTHNGQSALRATLAGAGRGGRGGAGTKLVSTHHFLTMAREARRGVKGWASEQAHGWVGRRTDRFVAISDAVREAAVRRDPSTARRTVRVHNGATVPVPCRNSAAVRAELNVAGGVPLILSVARLEREKDAALLLAAAERLPELIDGPWAWRVAGGGSLEAELRVAARAATAAGRLPGGAFAFLGRRDDVPDLMAAADALVHAAPAEPFGLVLIEAMALGVPTVASRGGAAPEIVLEGETGRLFEVGSAQEMAVAVAAVLKSGNREALGLAGQERFRLQFTAERMAAEMVDVYRSACDPSS